MGKITKVIYICDICGTESELEFLTCKCKKDYCQNCASVIDIKVTVTTIGKQETILNHAITGCKDCMEKEIKAMKKKTLQEVAGQFFVKA